MIFERNRGTRIPLYGPHFHLRLSSTSLSQTDIIFERVWYEQTQGSLLHDLV